jgi:DNA-binding MarR family transcriptional regulator
MVDDIMDDSIVDLFLQEKPCRALYAIENLKDDETYATNVSKMIDTNYAHTVKILGKFEEMGLTESEKEGRKKFIRFTEEGSELLDKLRPLLRDTFDNSLDVELGMKEKSRSNLQGKYGG